MVKMVWVCGGGGGVNNDAVSNGENGGSISTHLRKSTWSACTLRQRKPRWMRAVQLSI
jgi:hypothetical protein